MPKKGIFSGQDQWLRLLVTEYTDWRCPFLVANFNTMKNTWRDIVGRPFTGWMFFMNLATAWILLQIIKSIATNNGYIIGGLTATFLLFFLAWLVGLPYALRQTKHKASSEVTEQKQSIKIERKTIYRAIAGIAVIFFVWYGFSEYNNNKKLKELCVQAIDYNGSVYKMKYQDEYFQDALRFKTKDEAMTYCKLKIDALLDAKK